MWIRNAFAASLGLSRVVSSLPIDQDAGLEASIFGDGVTRSNSSNPGGRNGTLGSETGKHLLNFQVYPPMLAPADSSCQVTLMDYGFAHSYYQPFVGTYKPPSCKFDRVVLNFTLHTFGSQFDRLGMLYLGDSEVFRTTTAEPAGNDIAYTYWKEVDEYLPLWQKEQKIIFDMPNIVDDTYTGILYTTLTATFYLAKEEERRAAPDQILAISTMSSKAGKSSSFGIPGDARVTHKLPANVNRAVVGIFATGQKLEEFWYKNALTSDDEKKLFPESYRPTRPHSPFREVQLVIDGQLAGVVWPFPGIFTGGINPAFWRPMVAIDAFDLRQVEIDITPWLGLLCDGKAHTFEFRVAGLEDDGRGHASLGINKVEADWFISGNIFLFLGDKGQDTTKWISKPSISAPEPKIAVSSTVKKDASGTKTDSLSSNVKVDRSLSVTATLASDPSKKISWSQTLSFTNNNKLSNKGDSQNVQQKTTGLHASLPAGYVNAYDYPHNADWTYKKTPQGLDIKGSFAQGQTINLLGPSLLPNRIQDASFGQTKSQCPVRRDFTSWPKSMFDAPQLAPASFQVVKHSGKATYYEHEGEQPYETGTNDITQDFGFTGLCIPADTSPEDLRRAASQQRSKQTLEEYTRSVKILNQDVKRDDERLVVGGKGVDVPSTEGIMQWRRPVSLAGVSDQVVSGQPTNPSGIDASLQAILGVGSGEVGPGFQNKPLGAGGEGGGIGVGIGGNVTVPSGLAAAVGTS